MPTRARENPGIRRFSLKDDGLLERGEDVSTQTNAASMQPHEPLKESRAKSRNKVQNALKQKNVLLKKTTSAAVQKAR